MRITRVLRSMHLPDQFEFQWVLRRRKVVKISSAESILTANGINIMDIKDAVRPAFEEEPYTPLIGDEVVAEEKPICYLLKNNYNPLANIQQSQLITKTIVLDSFPSSILSKVQESTNEEKNICRNIIIKSNLLDSEQKRQVLKLDINLPGYRPRRQYNIPEGKKMASTIKHMFLHLEMSNSSKEARHLLPNMPSRIAFQHPDGLVQMDHDCSYMIGSKQPLEPIAGEEEVASFDDSPLPDLYPLSPFIHVVSSTNYDLKDEYALSGGVLKPHTVFLTHNPRNVRLRHVLPEHHDARTLVYAFSFAASYAKNREKGVMGDLKEPVRINIIHTNGKIFHTGIFQLNTLDFTSKRKNLFWHEPSANIYENVRYDMALPTVDDLNTRPYQLMKAILN